MTTIMPDGEDLRRAVKWISEMKLANPDADPEKLIDEACVKYDLKPLDGEFLSRHMKSMPDK